MTWGLAAKNGENADRKAARDQEAALDLGCIERIRRGEDDAFGELAARYTSRIFSHLVRMTGSREEAEDLTQETFIKAMRYLASYETNRPFRNWLYAIATNTGVDAANRAARRNRLLAEGGEIRAEEAHAPHLEMELAEQLNRVVRQLPPRDAALVHLHYFEGMSLAEAGEALTMTQNAAKVALFRARKRLRELLENEK